MSSKWRVERNSSNLQSYVPEDINHHFSVSFFTLILSFSPPLLPPLSLSHSPPPLAVDCGDLTDPLNGQVALNSTTFQSVVAYECDSGFNLEGGMERTCQASGEWSGTAPTCNRTCQKITFLSCCFTIILLSLSLSSCGLWRFD